LNIPSDNAIETVKNQVSGDNLSLANKAWPALLRMLDAQDPSFRN
jgi:hypothetical protein